jgi:hypothetical protein
MEKARAVQDVDVNYILAIKSKRKNRLALQIPSSQSVLTKQIDDLSLFFKHKNILKRKQYTYFVKKF